jgi:REP element-mobilizing transposase RayT/type II secretory pathway pseudopilin PulG
MRISPQSLDRKGGQLVKRPGEREKRSLTRLRPATARQAVAAKLEDEKVEQQQSDDQGGQSVKRAIGRGNRSVTVAALLESKRSEEPAGQPNKSAVGRDNRSLTVAALSAATPGLRAPATGPRAYFITFSCYGAWLHGDTAGSVDPRHNVFATPVVAPNLVRESTERTRMDQPPYKLDGTRRKLVLQAIHEVCAHRGWWLFAVHVRATHVHVIVQAGDPPEKVLNDFKTYASRNLNQAKLDEPGRKRWVHHGSTRYLWNDEDLQGVIRYVLHEQGEPMAVYAGPGVTRAVERVNRSLTVAALLKDKKVEQQQSDDRGGQSVKRAVVRRNRSLTVAALLGGSAGFTMMEIAISLAVIGIALVGIIGVLPIGMNVQQTNRQETIIGQDANVLMEAVRNGSVGNDDLTNYVYAITNYWAEFQPVSSGGSTNYLGVNGYTYSTFSIAPNFYTLYGIRITNGANIVGLMSTPEYTDVNGLPIPTIFNGGFSNHVVVYCHSMSGPAVEKPPQDNPILQQDSFSYRIFCVNAPPALSTNDFWPGNTPSAYEMETFGSLHELRMTFLWPQFANGNLGSGRESFRTLVAGLLEHQSDLNPFTIPRSTVWCNSNFWWYQPQTFTNTP